MDPANTSDLKKTFLVFAMALIIMFPLRGLIVPADHEGYLDFVWEARGTTSWAGLSAKEAVGYIYYILDAVVPYWVFTNALFLLYLFAVSSAVRNIFELAALCIISLPMFIYFDYITKESILLAVVMAALMSRVLMGYAFSACIFLGLFFLFALAIRPYYFLALILTVLALRFRIRTIVVIACFGLIVSILWPVPFEIFEQYRFTMHDRSVDVFGTRTVFPYLLFDDAIPVQVRAAANYFLTLFYVAFPLSWSFSLKEVFAQLHFITLVVVAVQAFRYGDVLFSMFGLGVLVTIPLFVPDLGTWVRHTSAVCFFFFVSLAINRWRDVRFRAPRPFFALGLLWGRP